MWCQHRFRPAVWGRRREHLSWVGELRLGGKGQHPQDLGGSSCMVKNEGKGRKMTGFQRHRKIVVLLDIIKASQTSMVD